jgi:hypothetical protein
MENKNGISLRDRKDGHVLGFNNQFSEVEEGEILTFYNRGKKSDK